MPVSAAENSSDSDSTLAKAAGIAITSPTEGQSLVNTNVEVSGTAPAGVLVAITITDRDVNQPLVEHQPFGKIQGSVTSDQNGRWIFTPQQAVVPSSFSVKATFTTADNQTVSSRTIQFVVTNSSGSAHVFSRATILGVAIAGSGVLLLFVLLLVFFIRRHRRKRREAAGGYVERKRDDSTREPLPQESRAEEGREHGKPLFMGTAEGKQYKEQQDAKMKAFEEETFRIEDELAKTAQELEQANAQVIALRTRFADQGNQKDRIETEPPPNRAKHKK